MLMLDSGPVVLWLPGTKRDDKYLGICNISLSRRTIYKRRRGPAVYMDVDGAQHRIDVRPLRHNGERIVWYAEAKSYQMSGADPGRLGAPESTFLVWGAGRSELGRVCI